VAEPKGKAPWLRIMTLAAVILGLGIYFDARFNSPEPSIAFKLLFVGLMGLVTGFVYRKTVLVITAVVSALVLSFVILPYLVHP